VTVTVCGVFQFVGVNVKLLVETVPSLMLLEETPNVTFAVGALCKTALNVAVPPLFVVTKPEVGVMVIPGPTMGIDPPE